MGADGLNCRVRDGTGCTPSLVSPTNSAFHYKVLADTLKLSKMKDILRTSDVTHSFTLSGISCVG